MTRTVLALGLVAALAIGAGCSSGNNKKNAASATPDRTPSPAITPSPLAVTPTGSPSPVSTPFPATTGSAGGAATPFPAVGTATRAPVATAPGTTAAPATATSSPSAATPPSAPPPPPPIPTGTARGGRDSGGATLPVGDLCPLGYPVKGSDDQKAYKPTDPEYATVRPVACFQTPDDAVTAGYALAHP
ncbi:MAG TPA: hypothetical protein VFD32_20250 [Dehalococcoidia bacterium]|nr:hypothetical protein [Dehalococcoidia bacterium]